jgi:hypothetical protein
MYLLLLLLLLLLLVVGAVLQGWLVHPERTCLAGSELLQHQPWGLLLHLLLLLLLLLV